MANTLMAFLKPNRKKLILPLFFLLLPLLSYALIPLVDAPYFGPLVILVMAAPFWLYLPFSPLFLALGLSDAGGGWFDLGGSSGIPAIFGVMLAMTIYAAVSYLIACLAARLENKYPDSILTRKW